jgi:exopolysaccharide biosynthesis polyprenyl glycosylphosphotransferase
MATLLPADDLGVAAEIKRRTPVTSTSAVLARGQRKARSKTASLNHIERWRILVAGDLFASGLAAAFGLVVWSEFGNHTSLQWFEAKVAWVAVLSGSWMVASLLLGSYVQPYLHRVPRSWGILVGTGGLLLGIYSVVFFFAPRAMLPRLVVVVFSLSAVLLVGGWRRIWDWASGHESLSRPIVIVGAGRLGRTLAELLTYRSNSGYRVAGFVDDDSSLEGIVPGTERAPVRVLGNSKDLPDLVEWVGAAEVVLAFSGQATPELIQAVLACNEKGVIVTNASDLYEMVTGRVPTWHVGANWKSVLPLTHPGGRALSLAAKRFVDVIGGAIGVVATLCVLPVVGVAIKLNSTGPVFYRQRRTGRGGKTFTVLKFRTMRVDAEATHGPVWASDNDPRTTRVGRFLRRTHLDELPQFINVLRGEMSLVGPRPERPEIDEQLERRIPFYRLRLAVKPGMAGWGAVNGSYVDADSKAVERLELDLYYIKHQSLWLDLQIIASAAHQALLLRGR